MISVTSIYAQLTPREKGLQAITMDAIKGQLEFLSSDWTEGRGTGEKGFYLAADYVASMFRVFGAAPAGDPAMSGGFRMMGSPQGQRTPPSKSYFQNFTLIESRPGGSSSLTIKKDGREYTFEENVDFSVSRALIGGKVEAPLVFVGYGFVDKANGFDDFAGVDVKGKIIVRLPGFPGSGDVNSPMYKKLTGDTPRGAFEVARKKNETLASSWRSRSNRYYCQSGCC